MRAVRLLSGEPSLDAVVTKHLGAVWTQSGIFYPAVADAAFDDLNTAVWV